MQSGLTNEYVNQICQTYATNFGGVFACDQIPLHLKPNTTIVVNLDASDKPGSHFVCLNVKRDVNVYFDPLGFKCYNPFILSKLEELNEYTVETTKPIQNLHSTFCGFFCIAFVLSKELNQTTEQFLKTFSPNNKENDQIALNYVTDSIKKLTK